MNLYLFRRPDGETGWDEARGFVVAAGTERQARELIAGADSREDPGAPGDEGPELWKDPHQAPCQVLGTAGPDLKAGLLLCDFKAG